MSLDYGVVSGCSILCLVCFFFVLFLEATHAVPSLTKCDRCFINAKHAVGGTVRKLFNFGLPVHHGRCSMFYGVLRDVASVGSYFGCVLLVASRGANHHGAITLVYCCPTHETVK